LCWIWIYSYKRARNWFKAWIELWYLHDSNVWAWPLLSELHISLFNFYFFCSFL